VLKKYLGIIGMCILILCMFLMSGSKKVFADTNESTTNINLNRSNHDIAFSFKMPKDGKIRLNINVKDNGTDPGILTFAIQTGYSKDSTKIKEITGITSTNGVADLDVELKKGDYFFYYELNNATGDLSKTELGLSCRAVILPTIADNISSLSVHSIDSFDEITKDGYEKINFGDEANKIDLVLPFTADKSGGLLISLKQNGDMEFLAASIYQDKECTQPVGKSFKLSAYDNTSNIDRAIPEKGTYYIKFTYKSEYPSGITSFQVKLYLINGNDRILSDGKNTLSYQSTSNGKVLYKFVIKDTRLLTFFVEPYDNSKGGKGNFRLLDKNKKALTKKSYVVSELNDESKYDEVIKYYTVNKGTFYLEVNMDCSIYQIKGVAIKIDKHAGTSKAKAKLLKNQGVGAEGYFTISDTSKVGWFKFEVTSAIQYIDLTIGYKLDGNLTFQIVDSKGKVLYDSSEKGKCIEGYYYNWVGMNYSKGTYYIKVFKGSKSSSVNYAVILAKLI
jgi:hypothetical protein